MGTIAQKLEYLNDTRLLLKDNINKINNVLTDNSTFRSYPQELFNGYLDILNNGTDTLWNNLEKVSASGEEATLENVETAPMKMVLNGNTSQETTTGKNLFTGLIKNVRLDPNNGEEFSGSTGATTDFIPVNINSNISYYLSGLVDTIRSFTCAYNSNKEFLGRTSAQTVSEKALTVGSFTAGTPTGTGDIAYIRITQYIQGEGTIDIIDGAKMQLEQGSTATSYEPYTGGQPSPNPDYPQEVKVVKGENVVSVSGKNLINISQELIYTGDTYVEYENGFILDRNTSRYVGFYLPKTIEAGTYTISCKLTNDTTSGVRTNIVGNSSQGVNLGATGKATFTTTESKNKFYFYISNSDVDTTATLTDIQLELGSTATNFVPYSKTDYPIDLIAKNIFDKDNANILNAWINASTKVITSSSANRTIWVEAESNTTYKIKKLADTSSNGRFRVGSSPNVPVVSGTLAQAIQDDTAEEITITTGATDKYIAVFCYNTSSSISLDDILSSLEIRETSAVYEEMCKIGDYKDYFYKDSGKWYVHKEINKHLLKPTSASLEENGIRARYNVDTPIKGYPTAYCNYFGIATSYDRAVNTNGNYPNLLNVNTTGTLLCNIAGYTTTTQYIDFFNDNDVYFYYPLATPIEVEITNLTLIEQLETISKAKSVKDKTYITQTNDELPFILDVEAIKEYEVN